MKSVISMIVVFIGLYIVIYNDIMSFFAQKWFLLFAGIFAITMLIIAIIVLGSPFKIKKRGDHNE